MDIINKIVIASTIFGGFALASENKSDNSTNNTTKKETDGFYNVAEHHGTFTFFVSILLIVMLIYAVFYLYKKYKISKTRLDYEVDFLKDKQHHTQELVEFR